MSRARLIGTVLGLILLVCAGVIYADQKGMFGGQSTAASPLPATGTPATTPGTAPVPQPANSSGYGDVK